MEYARKNTGRLEIHAPIDGVVVLTSMWKGGQFGEAQEGDEILMVWAEAEPDEGAPPLSVQLKADVSGGQGDRKIKWDFGDSTPPSSELNPTHKYEKAGTYRASVEVSDATGDSDSDYVDIEVGSQ